MYGIFCAAIRTHQEIEWDPLSSGGYPGKWLHLAYLNCHHAAKICRGYCDNNKNSMHGLQFKCEQSSEQYSLYCPCVSVNPSYIPGLRWWDPWPLANPWIREETTIDTDPDN